MKQRKCPYKGDLCYEYGECEECEWGNLITKYENKIKWYKNKVSRLEKEAEQVRKEIAREIFNDLFSKVVHRGWGGSLQPQDLQAIAKEQYGVEVE